MSSTIGYCFGVPIEVISLSYSQALLVFPQIDDDCGQIQDACNRLEMTTFTAQSFSAAIESFQNMTNGGHNLIIVDGRSPYLLDPETVARYVQLINLPLQLLFCVSLPFRHSMYG